MSSIKYTHIYLIDMCAMLKIVVLVHGIQYIKSMYSTSSRERAAVRETKCMVYNVYTYKKFEANELSCLGARL